MTMSRLQNGGVGAAVVVVVDGGGDVVVVVGRGSAWLSGATTLPSVVCV